METRVFGDAGNGFVWLYCIGRVAPLDLNGLARNRPLAAWDAADMGFKVASAAVEGVEWRFRGRPI